MSPPIVKKAEIKPNAYVPPGPIGNTQGLIVPKTHANAAAAPAPVIKPAEEEEGWWKRWGSDVTHGVLDVVGLVPVFGEVADLANAGIYTAEGDYVNAGISVAAMVPGLGMAATGAKVGTKVAGAAVEGSVKVAAREGTEEVAEAAAEKVAKEAEEVVPKKSNKNDGGGDDAAAKPKPLREQYLGRTPGKDSKTGKEVQDRMRDEGKLRDGPDGAEFKASDGEWYPIKDADMAHNTDAVKWWNETGRHTGAKSPEVRNWMLDSKNYTLDHYSINRSSGAKLPDRYLPPTK